MTVANDNNLFFIFFLLLFIVLFNSLFHFAKIKKKERTTKDSLAFLNLLCQYL